MAYEVIARRWRPHSFEELVGQPHISRTLLNALKSDRLPHALLFTGPRGTGKTSSARILAKTLRCQNIENFVPCNTCSDCTEISDGSSLTVMEIDGASNNGVEAIRELRDTVGYMPTSGHYKIYIIDEVHMLSTSAFNALLKTLEEPPAHVKFILATTEVHKIPNTILSRCQRFDFRRISIRAVSDQLMRICKEDGIEAAEDALWVIARQGEGSMRDSLSLLDQVITYSDQKISLQETSEILGLTDRTLLLKATTALVERSAEQALDVIQTLSASGYDAVLFIHDLLEEVRHLLMIKVGGHRAHEIVDLPESEIARLQELIAQISEEDLHMLFDMLLKGADDLRRAPDSQLILEVLMLRMVNAPRLQDLPQWIQKQTASIPTQTQAPRKTKPQQHSPPAQQQNSPTRSQAPQEPKKTQPNLQPNLQPSVAGWDQLVERIKSVNTIIGAKLEHTYLMSMDEKEVKVGVPSKMKFIYDQIREPAFQRKLSNYMNTFWGKPFEVSVQLGSEKKNTLTPSQKKQIETDDQKKKIRMEVENHPLIKEAKTIFKSEIQSINEASVSSNNQHSGQQ